jgi:tRNA/tmRNA/rRNA uracil-C5-methylase (TrmA/RlmC/RlmD family)
VKERLPRRRPDPRDEPLRRVRIEKLAPTGEGIARTPDGVGFIDRALPGELVETTVYEMRKRFWRGRLHAVREASPDRIEGPHASCAGCDWAHFAPGPAREAKRELFLETMARIGRLGPAVFGELDVEPSEAGYRVRLRLHGAGTGDDFTLGYFAPGSHRIRPAEACEAIAGATRELLPEARRAIAESGAETSELVILEDLSGFSRIARATTAARPAEAAQLALRMAELFQGVRILGPDGKLLVERGKRALDITVGARPFSVSVDTFFQANRHLLPSLAADVGTAVREAGQGGAALDAFGGVGLFAGALLDAGHAVVSVESDPEASADARRTRGRWPDGDRWEVVPSPLADFFQEDDRRFACAVVDPPRSGLGVALAGILADRVDRLVAYVSCDPATLARDLPVFLARGFRIGAVRLYDFFAFTHRVEALVRLDRAA